MRSRFPLAAVAFVLALVAGGLPAPAFDRETIQPGDSVTGDILVPFTFDEYAVRAARGSLLTLTISKAGGGGYRPAMGLYNDDYGSVPAVGIGPTTIRTDPPLGSGQYRILIGGQGSSVGGYRVKTSMQPAMRFSMSATVANPATTLTYGAYPGFTATITLKWKGAKGGPPVTLKSVTAPDGVVLASPETPRATASTFTQGGFASSVVGDHVIELDVPAGTVRWAVSVKLSGKLPRGTSHDFRTGALPETPTIEFSSAGQFPIAKVVGELGGPNECVLSAVGAVPDAAFLDGGSGTGGCSRAVREAGETPSKYLLFCYDGYFADVTELTRGTDGRVAGYEARSIRTPGGTGSSTLSGFAFNANGRPTGWTEVRRFDSSGHAHTLVFSRAEYFSTSGYCKAFRVVHTPPGGVPRTYDYAPF